MTRPHLALRSFRPRVLTARPTPTSLEDAEPGFRDELEDALLAVEPQLAATIADLTIAAACDCRDLDCASFYTVGRTRAAWLWRRGGRTIELSPDLRVDVVANTIIAVEAFHRPALQQALQRLFPHKFP